MQKITNIIKIIATNKKLRFAVIFVGTIGLAFSGYYLILYAFTVSDDFSTSAGIGSWWHATTTAGVVQLEARTCDTNVWFCGTGYDDVIVNGLGDGDYILVAKTDISTTKMWKGVNTACDRPQCSTDGGQDGDNLKADNTINFSSYPARDACKAIGGRLPTKDELAAIWTYRNSKFGANFNESDYYWSATEYIADGAWYVNFASGDADNYYKSTAYDVRCVSGW
jgi:hypothetical protein